MYETNQSDAGLYSNLKFSHILVTLVTLRIRYNCQYGKKGRYAESGTVVEHWWHK